MTVAAFVPPSPVPATPHRHPHGAAPIAVPAAVARWSTGVASLDALLGGGLPRGRVTVVVGQPPVSGGGAQGHLWLLRALLARAGREGSASCVDMTTLTEAAPAGIVDGLARATRAATGGAGWVGMTLPPQRSGGRLSMASQPALAGLIDAAAATGSVACLAIPAPVPPALVQAAALVVLCSCSGEMESRGDAVGLRLQLTVMGGGADDRTDLLVRAPYSA